MNARVLRHLRRPPRPSTAGPLDALDAAVRDRDWRAAWVWRGWAADHPDLEAWHALGVEFWHQVPADEQPDEAWQRLTTVAAGIASAWVLDGWTPETARPWAAFPVPSHAARWKKEGWDPAAALLWDRLDGTPEVAAASRHPGWSAADGVCVLLTLVRTLGDVGAAERVAPVWAAAAAGLPADRVTLLIRAGGQPDEIPAMHNAAEDALDALVALRRPPTPTSWATAMLENHKIISDEGCRC